MRRRAATLLGALALDLLLGEPPSRLHPVVWLGRAIRSCERIAPPRGRAGQLAWGGAVALGIPLTAAAAGAGFERAATRLPVGGIVAEAAALKAVFAVRALLRAGDGVRAALESADERGAREALRNLVSRETDGLTPPLIAAAAIESLAENTTDSVIAPWLAYAVGGLPVAFAYRAVNTLDSMIGYRGRYEYLGKPAARLDDLLNLIPARLTALLIAVAAPVVSGNAVSVVRAVRRYRHRTASPNAGWTMAAAAGALGVRLEKAGAYTLGGGQEPRAGDIRRARRLVAIVAGMGAALIVGSLIAARPARDRSPAGPRPAAAGLAKDREMGTTRS